MKVESLKIPRFHFSSVSMVKKKRNIFEIIIQNRRPQNERITKYDWRTVALTLGNKI